jgi:putative transposase
MTTRYDPDRHHRRSIRLKGYDYSSPGAYFVTICTRGRECVLDDPVVASIITDVWHALPGWFPTSVLDEFVVMPNHVHLIVWLRGDDATVGATLAVALDGDAPDRAGASPAPTETGDDTGGAPTDPTEMGDDTGGTPTDPTEMGDDTGGTPTDPTETGDDTGGAPTDPTEMGDDVVGATLAVTQNADRPWVIPDPERVNLTPTLGNVMGAFQSLVFTVYLDWIQAHDPTRRAKFWQRNYYDHIIRNERELHAIRRYIRDNPAQWALDRDNPDNLRHLPPPMRVEDYLADVQALLEDEDGG